MPPVLFADTFYWIALLDPRDAFHAAVLSFSGNLGTARVVTTDEVFAEVLSYYSGMGPFWRGKAAELIRDMRNEPAIDVLPQTRADFDAALALYEARPDKGWCVADLSCHQPGCPRRHRRTETLLGPGCDVVRKNPSHGATPMQCESIADA